MNRVKVPKVKCMFCEKKKRITDCIRIGVKQICEDCMQRLSEMLEFEKKH